MGHFDSVSPWDPLFLPKGAGTMAAVRGAARAFEHEKLAMFGKESGAFPFTLRTEVTLFIL